MKSLLIFTIWLWALPSLAKVQLLEVTPIIEGNAFTADLKFSEPISTDSIDVTFNEQSLQFDIANVVYEKNQSSQDISGDFVSSLELSQVDKNLRARVTYKDADVSQFKDDLRVIAQGNNLKIIISPDASKLQKNVSTVTAVAPMALSEKAAVAPPPAPEKVVLKVEKPKSADKVPAVETTQDDESKIPVFTKSQAKVVEEVGGSSRLAVTVVMLAIIAGVGFFLIRRYSKKSNLQTAATQIKILNQYHLSPKKSLAIIRVAGESILIGVTDQNISMIKSLSLLDEDIPEEVAPMHFSKVFSQSQNIQQELTTKPTQSESAETDEFSITNIKDAVSKRLQDMRFLG